MTQEVPPMTGPTPTTPDRVRVADRVLDVARADPDRVAMVQTDR